MNSENKIREAFSYVEAEDELKQKTKDYLHSINKKRKFTFWNGRKIVGAFAALVLAVGVGLYSFLLMPFSYVSLDVNPSLELVLNRLDWVLEVKAYNEDGENVLADVSLEGMSYKDAITCIAESKKMQEYLNEGSVYNFTIASGSSHKENELCADVEKLAQILDYPLHCTHSDLKCVEEAHKEDLSLGKYTAYQELIQYDESVTLEDCHHMSVEEMHHMTETHKSHDHKQEHHH